MTIANVELAIKTCEMHLNNTGSKGTEVESILTKYLIVHICAAYEIEIKKMVKQRAAKAGDKELESFVNNTIRTFRSLKITDIRGNLGKFSDGCLSIFDSKIKGTEAEVRYSNIVINRHAFAHGSDINVTFDELLDSYSKAGAVLTAIREALGIDGGYP